MTATGEENGEESGSGEISAKQNRNALWLTPGL